jgi:hypothetical protein
MIINIILDRTAADAGVAAFVTTREAVDYFGSLSEEERTVKTIYALEI